MSTPDQPARLLGLRGLWIAFPIADTLAAVITSGWHVLFMRWNLRRKAPAGPVRIEEWL